MVIFAALVIALSGQSIVSGTELSLDKRQNVLRAFFCDSTDSVRAKSPTFLMSWESRGKESGRGGAEGGQMLRKDGCWTYASKRRIHDGELYRAEVLKSDKKIYRRYFVRAIDSIFVVDTEKSP